LSFAEENRIHFTETFEFSVLYHIAGWAVRAVMLIKRFGLCNGCKTYYSSAKPLQNHQAAMFTARLSRGWLTFPSEDAFTIIKEAEHFFLRINKDQFSIKDTTPELASALAKKFLQQRASCEAILKAPECHRDEVLMKLLSKFFLCRMRKVLRDAVQTLRAKSCVDYAGKTALMKTLVDGSSRKTAFVSKIAKTGKSV
jgi:hypothetical protein